jgi:hypothetical protein
MMGGVRVIRKKGSGQWLVVSGWWLELPVVGPGQTQSNRGVGDYDYDYDYDYERSKRAAE